jgi:tetratricopeptide (TPR) repeat protein
MRCRRLLAVLLLSFAASPALAQHGSMDALSKDTGPVTLFDNLGTWTHPVTVATPLAQKYFDQGLRLYYGFNDAEAIRAFREAARLDPKCAMAWWGVALAAGPNINMPMDEEHAQIASEAIAKAKALESGASAAERGYIDALAIRYSEDPSASRAGLDSAYATAMGALSKRFPSDVDARVLHAESMMDLNPWNQWKHDGGPNPGTLDIVATLEAALKQHPEHVGANHFYIHAVEASPHPERALASAERLKTLEPGAGHLVHMPAHIYARVGRFREARIANEKAIAVDEKYIDEEEPEGIYPLMYYNHNIQFLWFVCCMEGRSSEALAAARKLKSHLSDDMVRQMPMLEMAPPYPIMTLARFGRWDDVLKEPMPPSDLRYASAVTHYARGLALVGTGRIPEARVELDSVRALAAMAPADQMESINYASTLLRVAANALAGEIAAAAKDTEGAVRHLRAAVSCEDSLHYDEPPTWYYPTREQLGAVLLDAGRAKEAETVYRNDLLRHPENGWSLFGLAKALRALGDTREADGVESRFKKAWAEADVTPASSAY